MSKFGLWRIHLCVLFTNPLRRIRIRVSQRRQHSAVHRLVHRTRNRCQRRESDRYHHRPRRIGGIAVDELAPSASTALGDVAQVCKRQVLHERNFEIMQSRHQRFARNFRTLRQTLRSELIALGVHDLGAENCERPRSARERPSAPTRHRPQEQTSRRFRAELDEESTRNYHQNMHHARIKGTLQST